MTDLNLLGETIARALPGVVRGSTLAFGELMLEVDPADIVRIVAKLRDYPALEFRQLIDICGVDWPQRPKRFDVVYHLMSLTKNVRVRIKVQLGEDEAIASVVSVHPSANWFEREAFDMFGI